MSTLSVGIDSYVTLDEANEIVNERFLSKSTELSTWSALSDSDKSVLLKNSCYSINRLQFKGSKKIRGQYLAFPRKYGTYPVYCVIPTPYRSQYYDNTFVKPDESLNSNNGLDSAKIAQVVNAVYAALQSNSKAEIIKRVNSAIKSRSAAGVSETYMDGTSDGGKTNVVNGIYTDEVYFILKAWITDSIFSM